MSNTLKLIGVTKDAQTAGPGKRFELFTKGCIRGVISPCEGCFNEDTWTFEGKYREMSVDELVEIIDTDAWNRQVTYCGGEPMLQARALMRVSKRLKEIDPTFHIVMYTAYKLDTLMKYGLKFTWVKEKHGEAMRNHLLDYCSDAEGLEFDEEKKEATKSIITILTPDDVKELMQYVDIIVDGDYKHQLRIPTVKYMNEGQFIGSSNQRVIFTKESIHSTTGKLSWVSPERFNEMMGKGCKCCGQSVRPQQIFCNALCESRFKKRNEEMKVFGGA